MLVLLPLALCAGVLAWLLIKPPSWSLDARGPAPTLSTFVGVACMFLGVGLVLFGWVARLLWFPSDAQRLEVHGRQVEATVTRVTAEQEPLNKRYPMIAPPAAVEIRFVTRTGPITVPLDVSGRSNVFESSEPFVKAGAKVEIVYDPENPQKFTPAREVDDTNRFAVRELPVVAIGFVLAAAVFLVVGWLTKGRGRPRRERVVVAGRRWEDLP